MEKIYYEVTKCGCKTDCKEFHTFEEAYKNAYEYLDLHPECASVEVLHVERNIWSEKLTHCANVKNVRK